MNGKNKAQESWERFLNPDELRPTLILASIYISTFEVLKDLLVSRVKEFFWVGMDENGDIIDPQYQSEVLAKNSSPVYASLLWLEKMGAITDKDIEKFNQIKKRRNDLAHEMFLMMSEGLPTDFAERFSDMVSLIDKTEKWWIINVEAEIGLFNVDLDGRFVDVDLDDVELDKVVPGPIASLRMLIDVALGSDEESRYYFNEFMKATHKGS